MKVSPVCFEADSASEVGWSPTGVEPSAVISEPAASRLADFLELTKPRIAVLVLVTVAVGGIVALGGFPASLVLLHAILGTGLVAAGSSVLNHWLERDSDRWMNRTADRPLPSGRLNLAEVLAFGLALSIGGAFYLAATTNLLATSLAAISWFIYVSIYTPIKRLSTLNTAIGAISGAMPPLIGWAAVANNLSPGAWMLFLIVYLWQFPHFFAIAWLYRVDYARASLKMLPTTPLGRQIVGPQVVAYSLLLIPVSMAPTMLHLATPAYAIAAMIMGFSFLAFGIAFAVAPGDRAARRLLYASLLYLPAVLGLLAWSACVVPR